LFLVVYVLPLLTLGTWWLWRQRPPVVSVPTIVGKSL
jgi:hypothetical protein